MFGNDKMDALTNTESVYTPVPATTTRYIPETP